MGTRGTLHVICNKQTKIAKYCQWDNYPSGRGVEALSVLKKLLKPTKTKTFEDRLKEVKQKVKGVIALTDKDVQKRWKECGADDSGWVTMEVSDKFKKNNAHLSRDMGGGNVLELVVKGKINETQLDLEFVADSLFCEWAYVIDLDKKVFEVYAGFNEKPLKPKDRFFNLQKEGDKYFPVKLVKKYKLDELPTPKNFVKEIEELTAEPEEA
jgi:hypothetical protein